MKVTIRSRMLLVVLVTLLSFHWNQNAKRQRAEMAEELPSLVDQEHWVKKLRKSVLEFLGQGCSDYLAKPRERRSCVRSLSLSRVIFRPDDDDSVLFDFRFSSDAESMNSPNLYSQRFLSVSVGALAVKASGLT